uniref:Uncharacterized protein n=1 Tax=Onchocerca volvulus TaxID=6282 RepID=A0A8R1TYJ7_ONCVO
MIRYVRQTPSPLSPQSEIARKSTLPRRLSSTRKTTRIHLSRQLFALDKRLLDFIIQQQHHVLLIIKQTE